MNIKGIQQYYTSPVQSINRIANKSTNPIIKTSGLSCDTFEVSFGREISTNIFNGKGKFGIKQYKKLLPIEIETLEILCNSDKAIKEAVKENLDMALILKDSLDEQYGKNNYVFVSIGRSPTGIARAFEFMGTETKYLPISGLRNYPYYGMLVAGAKGLNEYGKFLNSQGISNKDIGNSEKQYLFFDYTYKGTTLKLYEELIRKYYDINQPNMRFISLNKRLDPITYEDVKTHREFNYYLSKYLIHSGIEKFGGISELNIENLRDIKKCKKFSTTTSQMYNFLLIRELDKRGLLRENPNNKKSL